MKIIIGLLLLAAFAFGDDHGSRISSATTVGTSSTTQGKIETMGDVDFFKVVLPVSGTLNIYTTGTTDTYGYLFDSAGRVVAANDDSGAGHNFRIIRNSIAAGTYYIKVRHYFAWKIGSYSLHVEFTAMTPPPTDDHGNIMSSATTVGLNSTTAGNIETDGDVDFFKIVLPSPGTLSINTAGDTDTYGYLLNSEGVVITFNDDSDEGYNFRISQRLMAGTYYVKVKHYYFSGAGRYTLNVVFTPYRPITDPADDHGNFINTATTVELNSVTNGNIEQVRDVDLFKIVVPTAGTLVAYTTGNTDTYGFLLDSAGFVITNDNDNSSHNENGIEYNFVISRHVTAGIYYVKVKHFYLLKTGSYVLHVNFRSDVQALADDHGDNRSTATAVELNSTTQGNIEVGGDVDYFRINVPARGTLVAYTVGNIDTYGYLRNSVGAVTSLDDNSGEGNNFKIRNRYQSAGTYYIEVKHNSSIGTGNYQLHIEFTPDPVFIDDHGNSRSTATVVAPNSITQGNIDRRMDFDFFKIELPVAGTFTAYTTGSTYMDGYLYGADGTLLLRNRFGGAGSNFRLNTYHWPAGTYYIELTHHYSGGTGHYELHVEFERDIAKPILRDHGNSMATATHIELPSVTRSNIEIAGDVDFFKFEVLVSGMLYASTTGATDTYGYLLDSNGTVITSNNDGTTDHNFMITRHLPVGTYYIKVRHADSTRTGKYLLHAKFRPNVQSATPDIDDHSNSNKGTTMIGTPSATAGRIERARDIDFFRVAIPSPGRLIVFTTGSLDTYGELMSATRGGVASDDDSGELYNFKISRRLPAGVYFVSVRSYDYTVTGAYTLNAKFIPDSTEITDDHGNFMNTATLVGLPSTTQGRIETAGDADEFKVVVSTPGLLVVRTTGPTDTYGYLLSDDDDDSIISSNDDGGEDENFRISRYVQPGTYYIHVKHYYPTMTGSYSVVVDFDSSN